MDWVIRQDGGQPIVEATAELVAKFPDHEALIRAFYERWHEMVAGVLEEGVAIIEKLEAADVPLFGLTNWSAETFPYAWEHYPVLRRFRDIVVSGRVKLVKPDPAIFAAMRDGSSGKCRASSRGELVFIDDNLKNARSRDGARLARRASHQRRANRSETARVGAAGLRLGRFRRNSEAAAFQFQRASQIEGRLRELGPAVRSSCVSGSKRRGRAPTALL